MRRLLRRPPTLTRESRPARNHLVKRAKSQLGTKYRYGGETPRRSFDCSGFTRWTFKKVTGLPHNSMKQYRLARKPGYKRVSKRRALHRGDLVFFKTTSAKVGHAGMYIGRGKFIHASSGADKVTISSVYDRYYYGPRFPWRGEGSHAPWSAPQVKFGFGE